MCIALTWIIVKGIVNYKKKIKRYCPLLKFIVIKTSALNRRVKHYGLEGVWYGNSLFYTIHRFTHLNIGLLHYVIYVWRLN